MRPASAGASRTGSVTSIVSDARRASRLAAFSTSRRALSASVTRSLARLIAAPCVLRSSGGILPSVASSAEIEPFLPRAATRTASSAASSPAAAISARIWLCRLSRLDITAPRSPTSPWRGEVDPRSGSGGGEMNAGRRSAGHPTPTPPRDACASPTASTLPLQGRVRKAYAASAALTFGNRLERGRLADREIGQHLAIDRDAGFRKPVDEPAIGHAERANRRIEALDPQRTESALLALAVAESVLRGLFHRGLGGADRILAAAVIALGGLIDFLVLGVRGHTAFDASHDGSPI